MSVVWEIVSATVEILGAISALKISWKVYRLAYRLIWGYLIPSWRKPNLLKYGKWAVVTGCTDGIGRACARELARHGMSVVLISRTQQKLDQLAAEIKKEFKVDALTIKADFSQGKGIYDGIMDECKHLDIGILVNNVGVSLDSPMATCEVTEDLIWKHLTVNMGSVAMLCRRMLPQMARKRCGAIVNISSASAIGPLPYLNVYAASKKFVEFFSRGLAVEYEGSGVTVQNIMPFYVATSMMSYSDVVGQKNLLVPDAEMFASSCLRTLGRLRNTTGYWIHELLFFVCHNQSAHVYMTLGEHLQNFIKKDAMKKNQE